MSRKLVRIFLCFFILSTAGISTLRAQVPTTDIFLVDVKIEKDVFLFGIPENITVRQGYDNQPFFLPGGESLMYTSIREDGQADIYFYDIGRRFIQQKTFTAPEAEYSPTLMPGGKFFSTIRVESDGAQRLWKFPLSGGEPEILLYDVKPVGYHAWINENTVVMFVLGSDNPTTPVTMQIADVIEQGSKVIAENIGRSLHKIPGENTVSFVQNISGEEGVIKRYNNDTGGISPIIKVLPESMDYCWTSDGIIIMGSGAKLYKFRPVTDEEWTEIADFSESGIKNISRLSFASKTGKLAFVAEK